MKGTVEEGLPEFAVHYANNVFMFKSEENRNTFIDNPRRFVNKPPEMPSNFRILMLGPRGVGKKTQADMLAKFYGWRVVNFQDVVQKKLAQLLKLRVKPPNNFVKDGKCMIGMSQEELDKVKEGHSMPAWKFLPWILEFLGVPMKRRPIVPKEPEKEPNVEEMTPEELKAY
jgi:YHS domain-containing protein